MVRAALDTLRGNKFSLLGEIPVRIASVLASKSGFDGSSPELPSLAKFADEYPTISFNNMGAALGRGPVAGEMSGFQVQAAIQGALLVLARGAHFGLGTVDQIATR
jgi:hypothetical protein